LCWPATTTTRWALEYKRVRAVFANMMPGVLRITLDDGTVLGLTPGHEVWINERGWVEAGTAIIGETMLHEGGQVRRIESIEPDIGDRLTYTLWVEGSHSFFANGVWVHNCGWRIIRWGKLAAHVRLHNKNDVSKKIHGVFDNDAVRTAENAWDRAQQLGLTKPDAGGGINVPMGGRIGWEGGSQGSGAALEYVRLVFQGTSDDIITAYPIRP
jgi:hypothetical protein